MLRLITQRLLLAVPTMLVVGTLTFFLIKLVPGNPANELIPAGGLNSQKEIATIDRQLGLDKPIVTQYFDWLAKALQGNLGNSYISKLPVTTVLKNAVPATLSLALLGTIVAVIFGLTIGVSAAVKGGAWDRVAGSLASLGLGIPNFWFAFVLVFLFAIEIHAFPATGFTPISRSPLEWIHGLILPVFAISVNNMAQICFQARSATLDVLSSDFVRTLQAAGISRRRIILRHVLRNAAIPIVTVAGFVFVVSLGGVVIIESIFDIGGVGEVFLTAVHEDDLPVVQGAILYFTVAVVVVNLLVDLSLGWIDPRVRRA